MLQKYFYSYDNLIVIFDSSYKIFTYTQIKNWEMVWKKTVTNENNMTAVIKNLKLLIIFFK